MEIPKKVEAEGVHAMDTAEPLAKLPRSEPAETDVTAEPPSKKPRRIHWKDETMRKPLQEVRFIPKENIGKR